MGAVWEKRSSGPELHIERDGFLECVDVNCGHDCGYTDLSAF